MSLCIWWSRKVGDPCINFRLRRSNNRKKKIFCIYIHFSTVFVSNQQALDIAIVPCKHSSGQYKQRLSHATMLKYSSGQYKQRNRKHGSVRCSRPVQSFWRCTSPSNRSRGSRELRCLHACASPPSVTAQLCDSPTAEKTTINHMQTRHIGALS